MDKTNSGISRKFPYEMVRVDPVLEKKILEKFKGWTQNSFYHVGPDRSIFPSAILEAADDLWNFRAHENDIWVVTHPRSGTTLIQEMAWLIANNMDFEGALKEQLLLRAPYFERVLVEDEILPLIPHAPTGIAKAQYLSLIQCTAVHLENRTKPKVMKTHLLPSLMPPSVSEKGAKIIFVVRNPRDVALSYFHHCRSARLFNFTGNFTDFWDFLEWNAVLYPHYWAHIKEGWAKRNDPNVLFLFYEDVTADLASAIRKIAHFLGQSITDGDVAKLAKHMDVNTFKKNQSVNRDFVPSSGLPGTSTFIRKGRTSEEWPEEYTPELIVRARKWIAAGLADCDIEFPGFKL